MKYQLVNKITEEIITPHYVGIAPNGELYSDGMNVTSHYFIRRFTGLKDSKGVEIYEGDILKLSDTDKGEVDFYKDGWRVKTKAKHQFDEWRTSLWDAITDDFIVVGNVFQNGELLNDC